MSTEIINNDVEEQKKNSVFYRMAWRWHFYAGLFVIPFLLILSMTGMVMLYDDQIQSVRYDGKTTVKRESTEPLEATDLMKVISDRFSGAIVKKYVPGKTDTSASFVVIETEGLTLDIALNPYTGKVLAEIDRDDSWYVLANDIHGSLLLGDWGDRLIEAAIGFTILLIASGLYLWFGTKRTTGLVFLPTIAKGKRVFFKELHSAFGLYAVIFLLFFVLSGLSWSSVWGSKIVQAWNSFPAEKWSNVPLSDVDHSSLNHGVMEEVPWNLEQTPLPASRDAINKSEIKPITIDTVVDIAKELSMDRFQINLPTTKDGVYTLSADTMSGDITDPRLDRTVHIDQYTAEVLVDVGWEEYTLMAKFMAAGIALHQGDVGWINLLVNTLLCLMFITICLSGLYLWWLRKPSNQWALNAPKSIRSPDRWYIGIISVALIGVLFPLTGTAIALALLIDVIFYIFRKMFIPTQPVA